MAASSSLALKRLISPTLLLSGSLRPVILPAASRFFSTNSDDPFSGACGQFRTKSIPTSQGPSWSSSSPPDDSGTRREWKWKDTADALHLRLYMPGVGKEDVKVRVEQSELIAEGYKEKDFEDDINTLLRFRIHLPMELVKTDAIKAEMKNGVLKLFVPKIKQEEREG